MYRLDRDWTLKTLWIRGCLKIFFEKEGATVEAVDLEKKIEVPTVGDSGENCLVVL